MPTDEQIVSSLGDISNHWQGVAIVWHIYFLALFGAVMFRYPTEKVFGILLAPPLFSVSLLALISGNPFNGTVFALLGLFMAFFALKLPASRVRHASTRFMILGAVMFIFGWLYPHFIEGPSSLIYLYAAPTGLIPCPTLAIVTGMALMANGVGSRAICLLLGLAGLFYGVFGTVRLDVYIDAVLLAGAVAILINGFTVQSR